ncbi:MAG: hypothetical protein HYW88_01825 [Candidatus Sungbacteria bacterium]|nr:hypothetical protein [Candidatus Sungbacteria bacterium]
MKKSLLILLVLLFIFSLGITGYYLYSKKQRKTAEADCLRQIDYFALRDIYYIQGSGGFSSLGKKSFTGTEKQFKTQNEAMNYCMTVLKHF